MVCPRCIIAVKDILEAEGVKVKSVALGDAETEGELTDGQRIAIARRLQDMGFELLDDPRSQLVEQIRIAVLKWVRMNQERPKMSDYLSHNLQKDYSILSKLLCYSQLSTSEIAYTLGYSSPAHLSSQFKQVTGMTPKVFRTLDKHNRVSLDEL